MFRIHHAVADGISLMRVTLSLTDEGPAKEELFAPDHDPGSTQAMVQATTALLEAIRRPSGAASSDVYGDVTPEQLEKLLGGLDVTHYNRRHDDWMRIMMAAHYGTGGAGVDPFVAWSLVLLVIGVRVVHGWTWFRTVAALGAGVALLAAIVGVFALI